MSLPTLTTLSKKRNFRTYSTGNFNPIIRSCLCFYGQTGNIYYLTKNKFIVSAFAIYSGGEGMRNKEF